MPAELYGEIWNETASDTSIIARWHDTNVCLDCLAAHAAMLADDEATAARHDNA